MKNKNISSSIFYSGLYALEVLFLYALTINITSFYVGYTGAWITLFTFMVFSGSMLMYLLLNILIKNKKKDKNILRRSEYINIAILALIGLYADIKVAPVIVVVNSLVCFLKDKTIHKCMKVLAWFIVCVFTLYAYQLGWITMSMSIVLIFAQGVLYCKSDNEIETTEEKRKDVIWILFMVLIVGGMLLTFKQYEEGLIHIANEGGLFKITRILPWIVVSCVVIVIIVYLKDYFDSKNKINFKNEFMLGQIGFGVLMIICSMMLTNASYLLSLVIIMCLISFYALEYLLINFMNVKEETYTNARWIMIHVILCVVLVCAQNLYDGVSVDASVILMCAFMMYCGIIWNQYMFHDIPIIENEEEIDE